MNTKQRFLITKTSDAIGMPSVTATAVLFPAPIANAVPKILPEIISGGMDAPIEKEPMKANSNVAPMIIPALIFPIIKPAIVQVTNGLDNIDEPKRYSPLANIAVNASNNAIMNGVMVLPPLI